MTTTDPHTAADPGIAVTTPRRPTGTAGSGLDPTSANQRAALAVAMRGFAVVTLDAQIVNVALALRSTPWCR
jgi:hypothetical protein